MPPAIALASVDTQPQSNLRCCTPQKENNPATLQTTNAAVTQDCFSSFMMKTTPVTRLRDITTCRSSFPSQGVTISYKSWWSPVVLCFLLSNRSVVLAPGSRCSGSDSVAGAANARNWAREQKGSTAPPRMPSRRWQECKMGPRHLSQSREVPSPTGRMII